MSFSLAPEESLRKAIFRLARENATEAVDFLNKANRNPRARGDAVHEIRKLTKKSRALLRLIRSELGQPVFARDNAALRASSRYLSASRDAQVAQDLLRKLSLPSDAGIPASLTRTLRTRLREQQQQLARGWNPAARRSRQELTRFARRSARWSIPRLTSADATRNLCHVYSQGRAALRRARRTRSSGALHELRKQAKYLRYLAELLRPIWPAELTALEKELHELTDLLGEDHDLAMLKETSRRFIGPGRASRARLRPLLAEIDRLRCALEKRALPLAERIYAEKPRRFAQRILLYWKAAIAER